MHFGLAKKKINATTHLPNVLLGGGARDIISLEIGRGNFSFWFSDAISIKLGEDTIISFWNDEWGGCVPSQEVYPRLF